MTSHHKIIDSQVFDTVVSKRLEPKLPIALASCLCTAART